MRAGRSTSWTRAAARRRSGERGVPACRTEVLDGSGRRFLEVERFDRVGAWGRLPFVTLFPLDAAHYGQLGKWSAAADRMEADGWLAPDQAYRLRLLWWFGDLIENTDRHFGNIAVSLGPRPLDLAPSFDMLPMRHRPGPSGELPPPQPWAPGLPPTREVSVWRDAAQMALTFWLRAAEGASAGLRPACTEALSTTRSLLDRFG